MKQLMIWFIFKQVYEFFTCSQITGGSSGIGKQVAILAAKRGANVTILARDTKKLEEATNEIRNAIVDDSQKINYFSGELIEIFCQFYTRVG